MRSLPPSLVSQTKKINLFCRCNWKLPIRIPIYEKYFGYFIRENVRFCGRILNLFVQPIRLGHANATGSNSTCHRFYWSRYRPITFTRMFEPRHNIISNVRKYIATWLEHSRESNRPLLRPLLAELSISFHFRFSGEKKRPNRKSRTEL